MIGSNLKAFTILSETLAAGVLEDDPWSFDTAAEVAAWFRKAMDSGHTFVALPDNQAHMLKNGIPQRRVWVEDQGGKRLPLAPWIG